MLFNIDLNVFTVLADFICSGILFQIGVISDTVVCPFICDLLNDLCYCLTK